MGRHCYSVWACFASLGRVHHPVASAGPMPVVGVNFQARLFPAGPRKRHVSARRRTSRHSGGLHSARGAASRGSLRPDRLFDGEQLREGWSVLVQGGRITEVGPSLAMPAGGAEIVLSGTTLLPGLIEGHSHLLLHPYNETS